MESACAILRKQLLEDVPLAFSDRLEPCNVVDTPPVRVLAGLVASDTIQEFRGHSDWCHPAFFLRKGADDVRMVVDLRKLNVATNRFRYPFESTESVLQKMEHSAQCLLPAKGCS